MVVYSPHIMKHHPLVLFAITLALAGCQSSAPQEPETEPEQLYSPAPAIEEQTTVLKLTVPKRITIECDSATITGETEPRAKVKVDGKTVPVTASGTFSTTLSPFTSGEHSIYVTATAPSKKKTSETIKVERPFTELQFDIEGEYAGQGEVRATIHTNLWKGTHIDVNVFSVSVLNPEHEDDGGIDYSRWYDLLPEKVKKLPINKITAENFAYENTLPVPKDGTVETSLLLFHPEALKHDFSEIETLRNKYLFDDVLRGSLRKRKTFERDGKVVLDFRISQNRYSEATGRADNLKGSDVFDIKLPKGCKLLTYELYGSTAQEIQCTKTITASWDTIAGDRSKGNEARKEAIAKQEAKDCPILTDKDCYFYFRRHGNVSWHDAYSYCYENGGDLPSKYQVASVRTELEKWYSSYPKLLYVWTKETQSGDHGISYGWVESIRKNAWDEYLSDWATANSDKRDYVTFVCMRKR